MKKTILIFAFLMVGNYLYSQTYTITRGLPVAEIAGSGTAITGLRDGNYSLALPIGFDFSYFGNTYTQFYLSSEGTITFGSGSGSMVYTIPSTGVPNNVIAFASSDLHCGRGTPTINYFSTGTAPNRILVINYKNVQHYYDANNLTSVQIQLYEGSGKIEIHNTLNASGGNYRTIGIENASGNIGVTIPAFNYKQDLNVNNETIRFESFTDCAATVSVSASSATLCESTGAASILTANVSPTGSYTYQWYKNSVPITGATNSTYTATSTGSYFVRIKGPANCGKQSADFLLNPPFIPTLNAYTPYVCNSISVSTSPSGTYTYQWKKNNVAISGQTASSTTPQTSGTYQVAVTAGGCTVNSNSRDIANNSISTSAININACNNANFYLQSSSTPAGIAYSWTGPNGFTSTVRNATVNNVTPANAGVYSVAVNFGCGEIRTTTVNLTVNSNTVEPYSNVANVCGAINLNAGASYSANRTYSWTGPNGFTSTLSNPSIPNATAANAGVYTVSVNFGCGASITATTNVTVSPNTVQPSSNAANVCGTINLNAGASSGANQTYNWTGPNGFTSTQSNPAISSATTANAGVYTVSVNFGCGASVTATTNVVVNPNFVDLSPSVMVTNCSEISVYPGTSYTNTRTYSWAGPSGFTSTTSNLSIYNATAANAGVYTLTVNFGCGDVKTATTNVTVSPNTLSLNAQTSAAVCGTISAYPSMSYTPNRTYSWAGPNGFTSTASSLSISNATAANAGVYTLTVNFGCADTRTATTNVKIDPVYLFMSNNAGATNCPGANVTLGVSWSGSFSPTFAWSGPGGFSSNVQSPVVTLGANSGGAYTVTVNFGSCGISTATTAITVGAPAISAGSSTSSFLCESSSIDLYTYINGSSTYTAPSPTVATYAWSGPGGFTSNLRNPTVSNLTVAKAGFYTVTATLTNGCTGTYTSVVAVNVTKNPELRALSGSSLCAGYAATLSTSTNPLGNTSVSYSWVGPDGYTSTQAQPTITPIGSGGVYTVTATFTGGCTGTHKALVPVHISQKPSIYLSNSASTCLGNSLVLPYVNTDPNFNYSWTGPNNFTSTEANPTVSYNATMAMAGVYTLTVTDSRCSQPFVATTNITINNCSVPVNCSLTASGGTVECSGASAYLSSYLMLNPNTSASASFSWAGPNGFSSNSQFPTVNNVTATGIYTVTATSSQCTGTYTATVNVVVLTPSTPTLSFTGGNYCEGNSVSTGVSISNYGRLLKYTITGPNGYTYYGAPSYATSYGSDYIDNATTNMSGTYSVTATFQRSCNGAVYVQTATATATVTARPAPPTISGGPTTIELGQSTTLTASGCSGGGNTLKWFNSASVNPLIDSPPVTTSYWAICNNNGCVSPASNRVRVVVNSCPQQIILVNPADNYAGGSIIKKAKTANGNITATNLITGNANVTYQAKSIILNTGFKADSGTIFKAETGGCD